MNNSTIAQLLRAKKTHTKLAKKNLAKANNQLMQIDNKISLLEEKLLHLQQSGAQECRQAINELLSQDFDKITHKLVCNIYDLVEQKLARQRMLIWQANQERKKAQENLISAQKKLTKAIQSEEKILHLAKIIKNEQLVKNELISENID